MAAVILVSILIAIITACFLFAQRQFRCKKAKSGTQHYKDAKMESIVELAGGMAHNLLNPLTVSLASVQLLLSKYQSGSQEYIDLKRIEVSTYRCVDIINSLLYYSYNFGPEFTEISLSEVLNKALYIARNDIEICKVKVVTSMEDESLKIFGNLLQLEQAFMNIIDNALDAMPEGGTLTISINRKNGNVEIKFTDTGKGMAESVREKIFNPFFTTKKPGEGIGLGLYICQRIIDKHGGSIQVTSREGKGSEFVINLPENSLTTNKK